MKKLLITTLFLISLQAIAQDFWMPLELPNPNTGFHCIKGYGKHELLAGTGLGLYKTLDNGETWILTGFEGNASMIDVNYSNGDIFIGNASGLFYSKDSGNTWSGEIYQEEYYTILPKSMFLSRENNIFMGYWGGIIKTNYTGTEVEEVYDIGCHCPITSFTQNSAGVLFAGTINFYESNAVLSSVDGGNTWEMCWPCGNHIQSLAINSLDHIFVGTRYGFLRSIDNGNTWDMKKPANVQAIVIDPDDQIFIGCTYEYGGPGGVFYSNDHGDTWENISQGLTSLRVKEMALSPNGYLFVVTRSDEYSLFRTIAPIPTNIQSIEKNKQILVSPNPVNNMLTFSTEQSLEGKTAQIKIYNIAGEKVLDKEIQLTSNNSLDISYLQSGTFIFHLQLSNQVFTNKFTKL
ncbi:MAG TPA: T9SS type A sorting domain-containing protein [Salinivirgaceae bacterium]|nr:T9SS type A sorting domain-containing protein [Salinivirgaceae bacterium]